MSSLQLHKYSHQYGKRKGKWQTKGCSLHIVGEIKYTKIFVISKKKFQIDHPYYTISVSVRQIKHTQTNIIYKNKHT